MAHKNIFTLLVSGFLLLTISACGSNLRPDSPDVKYRSASDHEKLLLPPNTTDERGSLYIIPNTKGKISRSSILPTAEGVSFERDGKVSWLNINLPVEKIWPELVEFSQVEGWTLAENNSLEGLLITQWDVPRHTIERGGLMQKVLGSKTKTDKNTLQRYVLRIEREGDSSRLFVDHQLAEGSQSEISDSDLKDDRNPEESARVLTKILVFIGINEQYAKEILSNQDISDLKNGLLLSTAANNSTYLLVWDSYDSVFERVRNAAVSTGFNLEEDDIDAGLIEVSGKADYLADLLEQQIEARKETEGFFKSLTNAFSNAGESVNLVINFHQVEPLVYALSVLDDGVQVLKGEQGKKFLQAIKNAMINTVQS